MQEGNFYEIDALGKRLSLEIGCAVRFPAFDKNAFVCECEVFFPVYRLKASSDWSWVKEEHDLSKRRPRATN